MQQKGEELNPAIPLEEKNGETYQMSPVLQEEEGLKDHVTSTADEVAVEPVEGGSG